MEDEPVAPCPALAADMEAFEAWEADTGPPFARGREERVTALVAAIVTGLVSRGGGSARAKLSEVTALIPEIVATARQIAAGMEAPPEEKPTLTLYRHGEAENTR
ncbi:MAG: hypothetical protein IT210_11920 [Armatimonadetes bacterium]|nr:hypothetical protein [Armatimonadota bacterium]